ncbi:hypothetical protein CLOSTMETH_00941 [[Clostridium] methylpentosum DSM 5476]|uniref:Uncharacterized protein n=1 Tax=[Clostridium] methylpentosum DSM 5476 TaxID=537013 RepID=C0EAS7_9FIRM|nr:hypothetical protein CLOSTMETH_00941 [[Clostridium] methylpentosum DSM 5476]
MSFISHDPLHVLSQLANPLLFYMKPFLFSLHRLPPFLNNGHSLWFSLDK